MNVAPSPAPVIVIGGGPAGLAAAVAVASADIATVHIAPQIAGDNRTTALLHSSVTALETLGVWAKCRDAAATLRTMRIVDATARLLRAPEVAFSAAEIGLDAFGYNIANAALLGALSERAAELPALTRMTASVTAIAPQSECVTVTLDDGRMVSGRLVAAADGRNSRAREAAGIAVDSHAYPQVALTFNLRHARPHDDTSTEFHTEAGPFTLVPLPGNRSSLVWVVARAEAERLTALAPDALAEAIETQAHSILGPITVEPGFGRFPLAIVTARSFAARRIALVGEAGHVIPPIGAQGFNLGLRDAATIAELVADAIRDGMDPGADALLARYDALRRADIRTRTTAVDLLNRSLLSDLLPIQGARGMGLFLLERIAPLRRAFMREGVTPRLTNLRLLRGEPLSTRDMGYAGY